MTNITMVFVFGITWWLVLFTTLPFGVTKLENPEGGMDVGAPEKPRLWLKMGITTIISAFITGILRVLMDNEIISLRDLAYLEINIGVAQL